MRFDDSINTSSSELAGEHLDETPGLDPYHKKTYYDQTVWRKKQTHCKSSGKQGSKKVSN